MLLEIEARMLNNMENMEKRIGERQMQILDTLDGIDIRLNAIEQSLQQQQQEKASVDVKEKQNSASPADVAACIEEQSRRSVSSPNNVRRISLTSDTVQNHHSYAAVVAGDTSAVKTRPADGMPLTTDAPRTMQMSQVEIINDSGLCLIPL